MVFWKMMVVFPTSHYSWGLKGKCIFEVFVYKPQPNPLYLTPKPKQMFKVLAADCLHCSLVLNHTGKVKAGRMKMALHTSLDKKC